MTLPPYEPDGSLPPIPVEDVTAKDLIARYGVSKQTIYTRLSSIGVTGTKRGKQVFFSLLKSTSWMLPITGWVRVRVAGP